MANASVDRDHPDGLVRQLGLFDTTMMMVGIVVGSGIFLTTGLIAQSIPSPGLILLAWIVGGLLTLAGALIYAELGAAMPEAGGQYVYIREAYGALPGFLYGWIMFFTVATGAVAAVAVACAEYLGYFFPSLSTTTVVLTHDIRVFHRGIHYTLSMGQVVACILILGLSAVNYLGVGLGKTIQNVCTVAKIGAIAILIVFGVTAGSGIHPELALRPAGFSVGRLITGFGVALIAVSYAFDGWNNINYIAGEIKNPQRTIPRALVMGTSIITLLYVSMNYVYLRALPIDEMVGVVRVAEKAVTALHGQTAAGVIAAVVVIASFGALNGSIFVGPRVYYAMAQDRLFFHRMSIVHPRFRTPGFAILIQGVWACLLAVTGTFEQLFTYMMFVVIIFWIVAAASVFTLRKKYPDLPRPYQAWGYPAIPLLFIFASVGILINTIFASPVESLAGLGFTALGVPVYYAWRRKGLPRSRE